MRNSRLTVATAGLLSISLVSLISATSVGAASSASTAVTQTSCPAKAHYENAAHSGASCTTLPATPTKRWSVTLNGAASYPIIAGGKVFVTTSRSSGGYGGWLYALDAVSGAIAWGPVPLAGTYYYFPLAYGGGRVFVNNFDGTVVAFDQETGRQLWAQTTSYFSGEPVASGGVVYLHGSSSVYALSSKDGHVLWTSPSLDGNGSALATDDTGVYVNGGCSYYRLSLSGSIVWRGNDGCSGGGGGTSYLSDQRFFSDTGNHILDVADGRLVGSFTGTPAFVNGVGYFAVGSSVFAQEVQTLTPKFTKSLRHPIVSGPVIAGDIVYVATDNARVYGLNASDGKTSTIVLLPGVAGGGGQYSGVPSDIGVGDGLLVVPTGAIVTAYG
jgi:outer membrane protein assembly factor BamB